MYSKFNVILLTLSLFVMFNFAACSDDNSTGSDDPESRAVINGTVEDEFSKSNTDQAAKAVENSVVYAATFSSDGSVEIMENTETDVNASGEFSLEVDADAVEEVAIVAENEGNRLQGYIAAEIENGSSYTVKPLDAEFSAETDVYSEIKSNGHADIVQKSDIETVISADAGTEVYGNSSATSELAAGVKNSAEARVEFFGEFADDAEAGLDAYFETMAEAQADYEMTLHSSSSNDEQEAAFEGYLEANVNAFTDAGLEAKETAEFLHMRGNVILNSTSSVSSEVENDVRSSSSYMLAIATDNAVRVRAEASGLSETTLSAIADAGVTLRGEVQSSNGSDSSVEAAFGTYHDEVRTAIENDSSVEGSVLITIDTEINAGSGAKFTFKSALEGLVDAAQLTNLYIDFNNDVDAIVETNAALVGDIDTEILADIMVLINLSS